MTATFQTTSCLFLSASICILSLPIDRNVADSSWWLFGCLQRPAVCHGPSLVTFTGEAAANGYDSERKKTRIQAARV
jgi:hypothetical protein